jgi:hypothetical protein
MQTDVFFLSSETALRVYMMTLVVLARCAPLAAEVVLVVHIQLSISSLGTFSWALILILQRLQFLVLYSILFPFH